jgi:hypothetical protein
MTKGRAAAVALSALALAAAAPICGCGPFWVSPWIEVKESPLNWVEIHYYNMNRDPVRRISVYLNGMGHVEVKKGTSDRVSNDFAKRIDDKNWEDFKTQRKTTDPKHAQDIFQNLVNFGILDREKSFKKSKKSEFKRFIAVKANLSNYTYSEPDNIFEVDPDLAEELLDVVREFSSGIH